MSMLNNSVRTGRLGREFIVPRTNGSMRDGVLRFRFAILEADLIAVDPEAGEVRDLLVLGEVLDDPSGDFIPSEGGFHPTPSLKGLASRPALRLTS